MEIFDYSCVFFCLTFGSEWTLSELKMIHSGGEDDELCSVDRTELLTTETQK